MRMILVAGITNLETTLAVESFPLHYAKSRFAFHGVSDRLGGVGYNVAMGLARTTTPVMLATLLGRDIVGDVIATELARIPNLRTDAVVRFHDRSLRTVVLRDGDGRGAMNTDLKDSQEIIFPRDTMARALDAATHIHVTTINWALEFARHARAVGKTVSTDAQAIANPLDDVYNERFLALADIVLLSGENLSMSPSEAVAGIFAQYPARLVVCTLGRDGVIARERKCAETISLPAPPLPGPIRNQTGAGDLFCAGFLSRWTAGAPLAESLAAGQQLAGRWITANV